MKKKLVTALLVCICIGCFSFGLTSLAATKFDHGNRHWYVFAGEGSVDTPEDTYIYKDLGINVHFLLTDNAPNAYLTTQPYFKNIFGRWTSDQSAKTLITTSSVVYIYRWPNANSTNKGVFKWTYTPHNNIIGGDHKLIFGEISHLSEE